MRGDDDDRHVLVDQRDRAVFQLASWVRMSTSRAICEIGNGGVSFWSRVFVANEIETEISQKLDQEGDPLIAVSIRCTFDQRRAY
ncbi:hypothetical protein NKH82_29150 [Mesorhizobium sp. M0915]|uniref:hypothetical protein n=1 Tax=unclassified Mesorhizobium TaxID=325217 RepID=UPI003334E8D4